MKGGEERGEGRAQGREKRPHVARQVDEALTKERRNENPPSQLCGRVEKERERKQRAKA